MVRIAPVRLAFNPKTLWFDAGEFDFPVDTPVIVETARGTEFGRTAQTFFEATDEQVAELRSALKPVLRAATPEDEERAAELVQLGRDALPLFKQIAAETIPEMNPISVEYLFEADKAVFYFEAEDRVDFRELVRKLAAEFHVRVDMKQIGVRDEARMIGGYGHCGQELCCKRLGGDFDTVSIRMAKEQDLSLNPQKISGVCGRLMCCLRYEYDAYKDFHGRAPKKGAKIETPDGPGKVVDLDVPREIISIKVGDDKPVKVPLADMDPAEEGKRPDTVGAEAWEAAHEETQAVMFGTDNMLTSQLFGEDKLADRTRVARVGGGSRAKGESKAEEGGSSRRSRSRRRGSQKVESAAPAPAPIEHKTRRRRSTKVEADGSTTVEKIAPEAAAAAPASAAPAGEKASSSRRRRRRRSSGGASERAQGAERTERTDKQPTQGKTRAGGPGRNSSNLRASKQADASAAGSEGAASAGSSNRRRRRRSHKSGQAGANTGAGAGSGAPKSEGE